MLYVHAAYFKLRSCGSLPAKPNMQLPHDLILYCIVLYIVLYF